MNIQVIKTAQGPIETAIVGEGPAVLVVPGCPGGYDQGLMAARLARGHNFKFIALSRPGYFGTPLSVGATPELQADAYAALLDALDIPKAAIIGISGGGPSALQFALRHPKRCWALTTVSAISQRLTEAEIRYCKSLLRRLLFTAGVMSGIARNFISLTAQRYHGVFSSWIPSYQVSDAKAFYHQENLDFFLRLMRSIKMASRQKDGLQNDAIQLAAIPAYPLEKIAAPTLVLHGGGDRLIPLYHARLIANKIPKAKLVAVKKGGHLFFATHRQHVIPAVIDFLKHSARKVVYGNHESPTQAAVL
ncbi:MAG: alpha/beta fold hydrolase [Deltaproteobacteria bacterium]|nr:alpha/beta fold hydrolase [Deltaproteobacteria bacterium]